MKVFRSLLILGLVAVIAAVTSRAESATAERPDLVTVQKVVPPGSTNLIEEVERMLQSGAGEEVIKSYIGTWTERYKITADDILHLHGLGAPSDVLTTLIKRSSELEAQAARRDTAIALGASPMPAPSLVTTNPAPADLTGTNAPPLVIYPYPTAPLYTYSYMYPYPWGYNYSYRYLGSPFSFSYSYGWPGYSYWGYRPWYGYRYYPRYNYGLRHPGWYGRGPGWDRPGGWRGGGGFSHGFGRGGPGRR